MHNQPPPLGFLRQKHILGDPKSRPPILPIIPISKSAWWDGIRRGIYPAPAKHSLGLKVTLWRTEDIIELINRPP